jgi:DNA-binding NarL/FixJ family response regulator
VLSASEAPPDARAALDRGAAGFIPKSTQGAVLLGALRLVLSGGVYVPPLLLEEVAAPRAPRRPRPAEGARAEDHGLTTRQIEVLRLLARGLTNREISSALGIAAGTVKAHLAHIYEVLDVTNRTEAAKVLHELGLGD